MADQGGPGYLPRQAPIEAIVQNGFRFGGMSHAGAILSLPGMMKAWERPDLPAWVPDDFDAVLRAAPRLDHLVMGTGADIAILPEPVEKALRDARLALEVIPTRPAVRTYNILLSEDRRVAALFLPAGPA